MPPHRSLPITLVALAALSILTGCEATAVGDPSDTETALVTYSFDVFASRAELSPSSALVAEIAQDPNLGRLTIKADSAVQRLDAEYAFGSVAAFQDWRAQATPLIDRLAALLPDTVSFSPRLVVRRPALYRSIVGDGADEAEHAPIHVTYRTSENEAGGAGGRSGAGQGSGDAGDIDAVTVICQPGLAGTIEECKASN